MWSADGSDILQALNESPIFLQDDKGVDRVDVLRAAEDVHVCENCFGFEWDIDVARGDLVCVGCGCVFGGVSYYVSNRTTWDELESQKAFLLEQAQRDVAAAAARVTQEGAKRKSGRCSGKKYNRTTYFKERLSQWLCTEPPINKKDWALIEEQFRVFCDERHISFKIPTSRELAGCGGKIIPGCYSLQKEDVRELLGKCELVAEERRLAARDYYPDHPLFKFQREEAGERHVGFLSKYLEKWLSIRRRFSGEQTTGKLCPPRTYEELVRRLKMLDRAFWVCIRNEKRKSFPCFNEMVRNIFDLLDQPQFGVDFPALNTRRARKKAVIHWWNFCKYLKWPFLLKDAKFLRTTLKIPLR